ncbi:MAG: hypothetical protein KBG02_01010 [Haliscomenobacter sp.]|nr:hypothetical protein [Haliscomenobacter sp.]MBK8654939.1 hypothetical protein [Haliscomenobacter sp.]MBK8879797.1 hypothetical protein [Haliscomenobacter sp.]MBP9075407.1 hypothetical protein [Haliscomenobacter sp.]
MNFMVKTITIEIINERVLKLLEELELLQLIRLRKEKTQPPPINWQERYKGALSKQPLAEVDHQLNELRNEWE